MFIGITRSTATAPYATSRLDSVTVVMMQRSWRIVDRYTTKRKPDSLNDGQGISVIGSLSARSG